MSANVDVPWMRALYAAVLADFMSVVRREERPGPLYDELQWMLSETRRHAFEFRNVCDVLGHDPGKVRALVLASRAFPAWMLVPPDRP